MITQEFDLNLIPDSAPVVVHVSQFDVGTNRLIFHLYNYDVPYSPTTGASARIQGTKPDDNAFAYDCTISGNTVTASVTQQMTAVAGRTTASIMVTELTGITDSFNFTLDVEASSIDPAIDISDTDIPAIIDAANRNAMRAEVAAENAEGYRDDAVQASSEAESSKVDAQAAASAAAASETNAEESANDAEAWARGTRGGVDVPATDETYQNNSRYYAGQAHASATAAAGSRDAAHDWAVGPSGTGKGTDTNNAKYWAEQASAVVDIHPMDNSTMGIGKPDTMTAEATNGTFSAIGTTIVATINPSGTEHGADWLMYGGAVLTPDTRRQYRVIIDGNASLWYWTGTEYAQLAGAGGHSIIDSQAFPVTARADLQFDLMDVEDDPLNERTVVHGQAVTIPTEAEWLSMTPAERDNPNKVYFLPWMDAGEYLTNAEMPIGAIIPFMGTTAPQDYLACDGTATHRISDYPKLAAFFEEQFGAADYFGGDAENGTFAVPDLRGEFLRGSGTATRNTGSGGNVGEHQEPTTLPNLYAEQQAIGANTPDTTVYSLNADSFIGTRTGVTRATATKTSAVDSNATQFATRPTNTSILWCIKAYEHTNEITFADVDDSIATSGNVWSAEKVKAVTGTVLSGTLTAGQTSITFTDSAITADSFVEIFTNSYGVSPTAVDDTTAGTLILTFTARSADLGVKVIVR